MAKKKKVTQQDILGFYMDYVLNHNERPKSVYALAKAYNFEESIFYNYFGKIDGLDQQIFIEFFNSTMKALKNSDDYESYEPRHKLLSFYFTFFENLTANRSFVMLVLNESANNLKNLKSLVGLRREFLDYVKQLDIKVIQMNQKQINNIQSKGISESAWIQLLLTMRFWMNDQSANFEKTDIFLEKSVNTTFDLIDVSAFNSLIDLGKFMIKEKAFMN